MKFRTLMIAAAVAACTTGPAAAATPVELAWSSWGGQSAFQELGVLRFDVTEHDTLPSGEKRTTNYTLYFDTETGRSRLEIPAMQWVFGSNGEEGWATVKGELDERAQTASVAPGMINMKLFPALLPYSLDVEGVSPSAQSQPATFEGRPALAVPVHLTPGFFSSPLLNNLWTVFLSKEDHHFVGAQTLPTPGYEAAHTPGMRFRVTGTTTLKGVTVATSFDIDSIDASGKPTGNRRTMTITPSIVDSPSPALFMNPKKVEELENN